MSELDPAARTRIEDLLTAYCHCIDDDKLERWPEFFTADAVYQIIPREGYEAGHPLGIMLCKGRGMMSDRVRAMRQANIYEPQRYTHMLSRPEIKPNGAGYHVRTNMHVVRTMEDGTSDMFVTGRYLDVVMLSDGAPLFAERRVLLDSRRVDTLLVVPL